MLKSLRSRNIALLIIIVLAGQLLSLLLIWVLAIRPQAERVGGIMARNVAAISMTMDTLPQSERTKLINRINQDGAIRLLPANVAPPEDRGRPTLVETLFMRAFVQEMRKQDAILWRGGRNGQMWVRVMLGGEPYWISNERPKGWSPNGAILASFLTAISLALIAGILLQRRIAQPLRVLADAADTAKPDGIPAPLPTDGPTEIAAVARSFNLMGERLAAQDAERTFMLAGVSHDLRTPLAKIRLALAMEPTITDDAEALLTRQLNRMDAMLAQFLDFARGIDGEALQPVDLGEAARLAIEGLEADVAVSGDAGPAVPVRPFAMQRAITNLVRNAMLHGAPPVTVTFELSSNQVSIIVSDAGKGVDPALLATLAQPFVRGDPARGGAAGTGLGLAIVRHVAEQHHGALRFRNIENGGFAATLILPRQAAPDFGAGA
jgi:two-component system, OmpR family, osmolarity sensor histidine kinase EnvZ